MYAYWTRTRIVTFLMTCSTCPCNLVSIIAERQLYIIIINYSWIMPPTYRFADCSLGESQESTQIRSLPFLYR